MPAPKPAEPAAPEATTEASAETKAPAEVAEAAKKAEPVALQKPEKTPEPAESPATTAALPKNPELPAFEPEGFVGLSQQAVRKILGEPPLERQKGQATIWSYRDDYCEFDLYFYLDLNTDAQRALTYELQLTEEMAEARNACLGKLRGSRRRHGSG